MNRRQFDTGDLLPDLEPAYRGEWVVSSLLEDRAERFGDRTYASSADGQLTYGELRDRAARVAGRLVALGVEPGDRVATMLPSSLPYLAAWFGIVWAGAIDVPVNTDYKGAFLEHVLLDSGARVLVVSDQWADRLGPISVPGIDHVVVVGEDLGGVPGAMTVHRFTDWYSGDPLPRVHRTPDDLAYIIYTSGTTGASKGVMHSNRSALWYIQPFLRQLGWREGDVVYANFPLFHQMGRAVMCTGAMWTAQQVALRPHFSASGFWDDVRATGSTIFGYLGSIIQVLHQQPERADDADNPLRSGLGAAAPPHLMDAFERRFGVTLYENYGSTECGIPSWAVPGDVRHGTMGRPVWYMTVEIHDEADRPVPAGVQGEIVVRPDEPDSIFRGYWRQPEATVEAFRNLWFHTGDAGYFTDDGYLVYTDRIKDSIRRRGENISSVEVEWAVNRHPDVAECAVYPVPSELTEDDVMVAVVPKPGVEIDPGEFFAFCIDTIPRFAVPRYVRIIESFPKTPTQRTRKFILREEGVTADTHDRDALGIVVPRN